MGAPTWPPTPEAALKETRKEYGETEGQFLSPEAFEAEWLQAILAKPSFQRQSEGAELGDSQEYLKYWMALSGCESLPIIPTEGSAAQDFGAYYLPAQLGLSTADSRLAWRMMLLMQSQIRQLGIHRNKALLKEIHEDWALRQHLILLIGAMKERELRNLWGDIKSKSVVAQLVLGQTQIERSDLPPEVLDYVRLSLEPPKQRLAPVFQSALSRIEASPQLLKSAIIQSEAQHIKTWFREQRLGIPPSPFVLGSIRPSWINNALKVNRTVVDAWKAGPKPLRLLNRVLRRRRETITIVDAAPLEVQKGTANTLDEWSGGHWKKQLVQFHETEAKSTDSKRYLQIINHRRQEAEALRAALASLFSEKRKCFQSIKGEDIDLDAFVRAKAQMRLGTSQKENWFIEVIEAQRMPRMTVLIDATGSAHYRFQQAQQEALALLTFASMDLPLEWEVWSFAGESEGRLSLMSFKSFSASPLSLQSRLESLTASGGSRLGAVLRWQAQRPQPAEQLVLWFSDLIPEDGREYALEYAEQDLWMAIQELKAQQQLHCFDFAGRIGTEKAQKMLGEKHYTRPRNIDDFPSLFAKVLLMYLGD